VNGKNNTLKKKQTNQLLGYPENARLLIINADDFGMCNSVNEAILRTLQKGLVGSTSVMVPCPWALHAMHYLAKAPEISFGVHLTVISDPLDYRWGPLTAKEKVPTLVDSAGYFYNFDAMPAFLAQMKMDQLEVEFRAQIEAVLTAGLRPTHLDWHALRIGARMDVFDLMFELAKEYGLALRVMGEAVIEKVQSQGLPTSDFDFLDSYLIDPLHKGERNSQLLRELPEGLSEWAVHPGLDNAELLALEPANHHERQTDFEFWTSRLAKEIIEEEGIILVNYRQLQDVWRQLLSTS
jgi:chitin disaccharide deacetylase